MTKFNQDTCEICGEPVSVIADLPEELQELVYRPGEDDEDWEIDLQRTTSRGFKR
jgi:hypothetical protein